MKIKHYLDFGDSFPYIFFRIVLTLEFRFRYSEGTAKSKNLLGVEIREINFFASAPSFQAR